jgi:hypothetical protein
MKELVSAKKSFQLLRNNKIIFLPNLLMFLSNLFFLAIFLKLTGLADVLFNLYFNYFTSAAFLSYKNLGYLVGYLLCIAAIDNFLTCSKYGMIKDLVLKGKTSLKSGFKFGRKHYFTVAKVHLLVFGLIVIPILIAAGLIFTLIPNQILVARYLLAFFMIVYLVYISIRLLFVYPVMTFEDEGAYSSLRDDIHFVKSHVHHTHMTWLFAIGVALVFSMVKKMMMSGQEQLSQVTIAVAVLIGLVIILIEMGVSIWEHIFIFESYEEGKKSGTVKRRKVVRKKAVKNKSVKKKVAKRKTMTKKKKSIKRKVAKKK